MLATSGSTFLVAQSAQSLGGKHAVHRSAAARREADGEGTADAVTNDHSSVNDALRDPYADSMDPMRPSLAHSTKHGAKGSDADLKGRKGLAAAKGSVTPFHNLSAQDIRQRVAQEHEQESGYKLSRISSGFSERDVIAYLVK